MRDTADRLVGMKMKLSEVRQGLQCENREVVLNGMSRDAVDILTGLGIFQNPSISPIRVIDNLLKHGKTADNADDGDAALYNTYPFGTLGVLQPRLLAICRGKMKLRHFLEEVLAKSWRMQKKFSNEEKMVIILTDKWDATTFRKHEKAFLNYALQYEVRYIILLLTDYGITEIPFLPKDLAILRRMRCNSIEDNEIVNDMIQLLDGKPIEFSITENVPQNKLMLDFKVYVENMKWERTDNHGTVAGDIRLDDLHRFVEDIWCITERRKKVLAPKSQKVDAPVCTLKIAGKTVEWNPDYAHLTDDKFFIDLDWKIQDFIHACEAYGKNYF